MRETKPVRFGAVSEAGRYPAPRRSEPVEGFARQFALRAREPAPRALPIEIGFLRDYGVSFETLHSAATLARRQGVYADEALLAEGLVTEGTYYRALADRLGASFVEGAFAPAPFTDAAKSRARGYVRLADNAQGIGWLFAPRGEEVSRLIGAARALTSRTSIAVTTRANFVSRLRRRELPRAATAAPFTVEAVDARLCARHALSGRLVAKIIFAAAALIVLMSQPNGALALASALPLAALFLGHVFLRLFACAKALEERAEHLYIDDAALPTYTVVAPLYREARIAKQLAEALDHLDYPRAKLEILFVVEADDPGTLEALRCNAPRAPHAILVAPAGAPKTKPRALNIAAPFARGELLAVFDAEDLPHPRQLRAAAAKFAKEPANVACLQASLCIDNGDDDWLAAYYALDYAALFDVFNPGLCALGLPMFLGGSSNHFKLAALKKVGLWDSWNVTEDADLGLRLARAGYKVETFASLTREEAPVTFEALVAQRSRWMKGWMQTALTHCRDLRRLHYDLGLIPTLATLAMFAGGFAGSLIGPLLTLFFLERIVFEDALSPRTPAEIVLDTLWCFLSVSGAVSIFWPMVVGMRRRSLTRLWPALLLAPLWQAMLTLAAWRGLVELCVEPYFWRKTEHGLARARSGAAAGRASRSRPGREIKSL
jgi:glycosyltransferase XagB